jgi:hypothetical protein
LPDAIANKGWANLRPVQPGERRNPSGRPRGLIGPALNKKLKKFDVETRIKVADLIADVLIERATARTLDEDGTRAANVNIKAAALIMEQTDPVEREEDTNRGVAAIQFVTNINLPPQVNE